MIQYNRPLLNFLQQMLYVAKAKRQLQMLYVAKVKRRHNNYAEA
ncbi:hypothetical protein PVA17_21035 [Lysinibacillus sp. CNPSo 3705]|nr:hypothetical protein [Lysinibacillus sp. CNPSo 3705]MDD1505209.1 hypothetical protein [Lysinibacillus sp. CNPSo 3705]